MSANSTIVWKQSSAMHPDLHCESLCCGNDPYGVTSHSSGSKTASHQSFAVLVDEVFRGLGPFGQNNIIYSFLGDLQATQIKSCNETTRTKHEDLIVFVYDSHTEHKKDYI